MENSLLHNMLLLEDPSVMILYRELNDIAKLLLPAMFLLGVVISFLTDLDFGSLLKKLLIVTIFIGGFQKFHTEAVGISLESASQTLKKVSPRNLFVKSWTSKKVSTQKNKEWNMLESFAIPNLNDLVGTAFFLLSKVFIMLLKLIYSSVYHLTYVFSGISAVLYFFGWTKDSLKGTVQASLWCIILPYVLVAILALVGNSIDLKAVSGELLLSNINSLLWLFGVTLLLLMTPVITFGLVRGDGVHSFGSQMGSIFTGSVTKAGIRLNSLMPSQRNKSGQDKAPVFISYPNTSKRSES